MILVTGGTGLVGSHLLFQLLQNSTETIRAIHSQDSNLEHVLSVFKLYDEEQAEKLFEKIDWVEANILDIPLLSDAFKGITHVYHCAGFISYDVRDAKIMRRINIEGTANVVNLCLHHDIKKLCHVSSIAAIGSTINDKPITEDTVWNPELSHSHYAWSKYGGEELCKLYSSIYDLNTSICRFYNVYGPNQISKGEMATIIGIFEEHYKKNKPLPVVKPGSQSRRFTHIQDTIEVCFKAWKENKCRHCSISNKKSYSVLDVAKMFNSKIRFLSPRRGERYASALTNMNLSNKVHKLFGKKDLKDYVQTFINKMDNCLL